jgi:hypothetical protein
VFVFSTYEDDLQPSIFRQVFLVACNFHLEGAVAGVRKFRTLEKLRQALVDFLARYNRHWVGQRPGSRTPHFARKQLLALGAAP